ncbi:MAG: amidohydrolase family protein [Candidatus Poseidonia sp.]|nr:amidohydrolase family protein [Poseidonia sp.]
MSRRLTLAVLIVALFLGQSMGTVLPEDSHPSNHVSARDGDVRISEILVSASSADYNGTDWNNDGDIGSSSDQFIELWNAGPFPVDVSDWLLDDITDGGSAPCRLAWNTTIEANDYIVIFRESSRIELDYWDGDTATISDSMGNIVDTLSFPEEDSWWDTSYVKASNGTISKSSPPTPGWYGSASYPTAQNMVRCYGLNDNVHTGAYVLQGRVVPMTGEADVINEGHVLVKDGMIEAVWGSEVPSDVQLTNVPVLETNGTIYPGMLDLHNHLHYNQAPLWEMTPHLSENNRNQWGGYNNRYEWKNHPDYSPQVTKPKMLVHSGPYWNMESEAMKYIEMKSLVGGATAAQGGPSNPDDSYATVLSRNIEDYNFGRDEIHTKVTELTSDYVGNHIKTGNASGELDAWFIHIAEGVDERSRAEFDILVQNNLLVGELVLIHGVALGEYEFRQMADVGATLVWSPLSNLLLYGQTADIAAAKAAGVHITLAPDWAPSGSKSPLHELKVADLWDDEMLGDIFTDYEMVKMVTSGAASATNWDREVGTIEAGKVADLVVVDNIHANPYRNLIEAVDPDVRLTVVGGLAVYGDQDIMTGLKGTDTEPAGKFGKAVDVTFLAAPDGAQTWSSIVENLTMAMRFDTEEMTAAFGDANDFDSVTRNMVNVGLDPWYTYGDERYFRVINGSGSANAQIDMSLLYDRYYDRAESLPEITNFEVVEAPEPEPCDDGSQPPCAVADNTNTGNDGTGDASSGDANTTAPDTNSDVGIDETGVAPIDVSQSEEDDVADGALLLFFGIIAVLLGALYLVSRGGEDALAAEVQIEKMWDEQEAAAASSEGAFVPSLPPLEPPKNKTE